MTMSPRPRVVLQRVVLTERQRRRHVKVGAALALILALIVAASPLTLAQMTREVRDRVVPAAIQVAIVFDVTANGVTETRYQPTGSGTVVSPTGHILTNWHVVNMGEYRAMLDSWEAHFASEGQTVTYRLNDQVLLILTSDGVTAPVPRYETEVAATDTTFDFAVLQIVRDELSRPLDIASLPLPYVPLGNSDTVELGDPVDIFGYPVIGSGALTYTEGVVSGFVSEGQIERAWINTDATISGGSSGGTAINRDGALIGVPTRGPSLDCRPGDMNGDGLIDEQDVGCLPTGGSIGQLRPINLALDVLARAGVIGSTGSVSQGDDKGSSGSSSTAEEAPRHPPSPADLLPITLPLEHAGCFRIENDHLLTFDELAANLGGSGEARGHLRSWGWQASANRTFACDTPPEGDAGWIDISAHLFGDAASAQQAVDYFAAVRAEDSTLMAGTPPAIGDHAVVLSGPATNGKEFTLYVSKGPLLLRVTGVSPSGIPFGNVMAVAQSILDAGPVSSPHEPVPPPSAPAAPASDYLPAAPAVNYAECFQVVDQGTYSYGDVVDAFAQTGLSQAQIDALGWRDGAYVVFTCAETPYGRANHLEVVIHQFQDVASAEQALPYLDSTFTPGSQEIRNCDTGGPLVICVTGRSESGSPLSDVAFVLQQVLATAPATVETVPTPEAMPTPTPLVEPAPTPTVVAIPTPEREAIDYLPATLPLDDAACFHVDDEDTIDFPGIVERFGSVPDAADRLQELGWQAGAFRQFLCETPSPGGLDWVNVGVHQFSDAASPAVPFFADARTIGTRLGKAPAMALGDRSQAIMGPSEEGTEYTLYVSTGGLLFRVSGIAPTGDPRPEVERVMQGMLAAVSGNDSGATRPTPTPLPTATAVPTSTPAPTATPVPLPTATFTPTPVPLPTATPTGAPPRVPSPTATGAPTATPRVVVMVPTATVTPLPAALPTAVSPTGTEPADQVEDLGESEAQRLQRISRALITYGASWGLKQYGGVSSARLEGWEDPDLVALELAQRRGGGANAAAFYQPFVYSAMMLANMGVLGDGTYGDNLYAGPSSSDERLDVVAEFIDEFATPGRFVDPYPLYQDVFNRALRTPIETFRAGDGTVSGAPGTQVDVTNGAIMAVAQYLTPESAAGIKAQLEAMSGSYMLDTASGAVSPDVSYPEYLEQHGAREWIRPGLTPEEIEDAF